MSINDARSRSWKVRTFCAFENLETESTQALDPCLAEQIKADIRKDLEACNAYIARHGSPTELARAHYDERYDTI